MVAQPKDSIGIAGSGRVARALGRLLVDAGEPVVCIASRDLRHSAEAAAFIGPAVQATTYQEFPNSIQRLLIAVSDYAISEVAEILARRSMPRIALHTCGARGPEALAPLRAIGCHCGALHPLQTIVTGLQGVEALRGIAFAVSGDSVAVEWAERIISLAQGEMLRIPPELRPLYHAAAVMTSNYVTALLDAGQSLLMQCGIDSDAALRALAPLFRTAVENAVARGPVEALTGPIERGDSETVAAHLAALAAAPSSIQNLYRAAGLQTLDLARRRGLQSARLQRLNQLLTQD